MNLPGISRHRSTFRAPVIELNETEYHLIDDSEPETVKLSKDESLALRIHLICNPLFCRK